MNKLTFLIIYFLSVFYYSFSQNNDTIKILFIGNSFTAANDLPLMFKQLAISDGKKVYVDQITFGGYTFELHSQNTAVINKINEKYWDYVILQEQSQIPSFIPQRETMMYPYARKLDSIIHANSYCTKTIFFMTWAHKYGDLGLPPGSDTYEDMQQRLRSGYKEIADTLQAAISPCGWAWRKVIQDYPNIELYSPDNYHPNENGTYLAACTFFATIFTQSPLGLGYYANITSADAIIFQNSASEIVLDSLNLWNIGLYNTQANANYSFSTSGNQVYFSNTSTKANFYIWNFDDGTYSNLINPFHTFLNNGIYNVKLVASNHCKADSIIKSISILPTNLNSTNYNSSFQIYPNPTDNILNIKLIENVLVNSIELFDNYGKKILNIDKHISEKNNNVSAGLKFLDNGTYFLKITTIKEIKFYKIIKI